MAKRIIGCLLFTIVLLALVVGGLLGAAQFWLPTLNTALGYQAEANKFLVIIPAAIATVTAALFNGIASFIGAEAQRKTALELANKRADFEEQLDQEAPARG
jgi:hypothetical protein